MEIYVKKLDHVGEDSNSVPTRYESNSLSALPLMLPCIFFVSFRIYAFHLFTKVSLPNI